MQGLMPRVRVTRPVWVVCAVLTGLFLHLCVATGGALGCHLREQALMAGVRK